MALSWNEIKERALYFSKEWADAEREEAEAKPFLVEFFKVFGVYNRKVSTFEYRIKKLDDHDGYIDLFWPQTILIEMKSRGKDLQKAYAQAIEYVHGIEQHKLPKAILVSDFENFHLYFLEENIQVDQIKPGEVKSNEKVRHLTNNAPIKFQLEGFYKNVHHFGFLAGYQKKEFKEQDPVNIQAAELMGRLHNRLKEIGYEGHDLEVYLVRLLFCLFAEDTTIFKKQQFQDFIEQRTSEDGSDLAARLQELFEVLNTPEEKRLKNRDEQLLAFPYINGELFSERLRVASFDKKMRQQLFDCCYLDWGGISPAIFGSMFQSVMNPQERRNLGAHYTSEKNIMKLIKPLFLDELYREFNKIKKNKNKLEEFHEKLADLKFLDPACGCGNFLVITYRELRLLEIKILKALYKKEDQEFQSIIDIRSLILLNVDQFYGIEIDEWPARISELAMWFIDHQMNLSVSNEFGLYFARLPLQKSAKIVNENALRLDWNTVVPKDELNYILGNPPFIGNKFQTEEQRSDMNELLSSSKVSKVLDYVAGWYLKSAKYVGDAKIRIAFVSTSSIAQGEQVSILWAELDKIADFKIFFAHRAFAWVNEAKNNAAVYVVIIGFSTSEIENKKIYFYEDTNSKPVLKKAKNINAYLIDSRNIYLEPRSKPICAVPEIAIGNKPVDGGNYLFKDDEKADFLKKEPKVINYFYKWQGAEEFMSGKYRWVLLAQRIPPNELKKLPEVMKLIANVKKFRLKSKSKPTNKIAKTPTFFHVQNFPDSTYIVIPKVSTVSRMYIPIGFTDPDIISSDLVHILKSDNLFHFGILSSILHNNWLRYTCGRLGNSIRYSQKIVYNNFPWPKSPAVKQVQAVEVCAKKVIEAREGFSDSSLADLYDPLAMPPKLLKAHRALDKAVDKCYRSHPFANEIGRIEFLFQLYEEYTKPIQT